jgi:hypothetical protein
MKYFLAPLCGLLFSIQLALGQSSSASPAVPPAAELRHFTYVMSTLGGTDLADSDLPDRRAMFALQYRLADVDAALMASAADAFRAEMTQNDAARAAILQGGTPLSAADLQALLALCQERDQTVVGIVAQLKAGLSAGAIQRIWQPLVDLVSRGH